MGNICCRIFKEQIDLINQLPANERAAVLYAVINNCFNQFDNQNENQIDNQTENQNENAYVSVSSNISILGKSIYNLLVKNITVKEFSNNYGGKRENAGAKKKLSENVPVAKPQQARVHPTLDAVLEYAKQQNSVAGMGGFACSPELAEQFWMYYESQGWVKGNKSQTPISDWKPLLRRWATDEHNRVAAQKTKTAEEPFYL